MQGLGSARLSEPEWSDPQLCCVPYPPLFLCSSHLSLLHLLQRHDTQPSKCSDPTPLAPQYTHLSLLHLLQLHAARLHCLVPALNVHLSPPRIILVSSLQAKGERGKEGRTVVKA